MSQPGTSSSQRRSAGTEVTTDENGIGLILLRNACGATARVSLYGGQVLSWKNKHGEEMLFTSSKAIFKPPNPVRGGIPICFPQFRNLGPLERHGFARKRIWKIDENPPPVPSTGEVYTDLLLRPSEEDLKTWPHDFEFRLRVALGAEDTLTLIPRIKNVDSKPFSYTLAFRTYFSVSDIGEVRVEGLETLYYRDYLGSGELLVDQGHTLTFEEEVDRYYNGSRGILVFDHHHERKRAYEFLNEGLPDVGVWNPWDKKVKRIADMANHEYMQMLCIDGASIEKPTKLKTGEEWMGRLDLSLKRSA